MDPDTYRSDLEIEGPEVYWRRRMAVLIGILVVVAVVAWACSSLGSGPERASSAQTAASPAPDPLLSALQATPTPLLSPSPSPSGKKGKDAKEKAERKPAAKRRPGEPCLRSDLVLDLRARGEVHLGTSRPQFMLTLVNTGRVMCTFDVGTRTMEILISSGPDRIWSSSDCTSGDGMDVQRLERGIPYVRLIQWDRHRSARDCRADRPRAKPGTYVATVRHPDIKSPKAVFSLR
jgi:hypothetical protein